MEWRTRPQIDQHTCLLDMSYVCVLSASTRTSLAFVHHVMRLPACEMTRSALDPSQNQSQNDVEYFQNPYAMRFNVTNNSMSMIAKAVKNIAGQKDAANNRHVIILVLAEPLKTQNMLIAQSLLNKFCTNAVFAVVACDRATIPISIRQNGMTIDVLGSPEPDLSQPFKTHVAKEVARIASTSCGAVKKYRQSLRDFAISMTSLGAPVKNIAHALLEIYPDEITRLAAMEHTSIHFSKRTMLLEITMDELIQSQVSNFQALESELQNLKL